MPRSTHTALWIALALTAPIVLMSFAGIAPRILPAQGPATAAVALLPDASPLFHLIPTKGGHGGGGGGGSGSCTSTLPTPNGVAYTPSEIQTAYHYNTAAKGTGQTIAIIDAYGDSSISSDLACFDQVMNLPAPPSLTVTAIGGKIHGSNSGWAMETALDVEYAHAMAPGANLLLLETPSASLTYLINDAVPYAAGHANVISMSWGSAESSLGCSTEAAESSYFTNAAGLGAILVGASGDGGANDGTSSPTVDYPAADPSVVGAGGTDLTTTSSYAWSGETVWNDASGATGGGVSTCFSEPSYQSSVGVQITTASGSTTPAGRAVPDVAYDASPYTGFWVWVGGKWNQVGGTSDAAPQWAGIFADARSAGVSVDGSNVHSAIYGLPSSALHDITVGNNGHYYASAGYDACTGVGSPDESAVISGL